MSTSNGVNAPVDNASERPERTHHQQCQSAVDLRRPIVFLDLDDVLCLNRPYSGFDVWFALKGDHKDGNLVLENAFADATKQILVELNDLAGPIHWVISSSWRYHFTREDMARVFDAAGLGFVAVGLGDGDSWATPELKLALRVEEIQAWLEHHHQGEPIVVIDDVSSGGGLIDSNADPENLLYQRVVLCDEGIGLVHNHLKIILRMLR